MGKYSGILLCSDFDGTLCVDGRISEGNMRAIRYFCDNGGKFTLCTGRYPEYVMKFFDRFEFNTPLIVLNGAALYDAKKQRMFDELFTDGISMDFINRVCENTEGLEEINLYTKNDYRKVSVSDRGSLSDVDFTRAYKIVFRTGQDREAADRAKRKISGLIDPHMTVVKSWHWGIEVQDERNTKGPAARRLAELVGAHTLVCVGDFENDISMVAEADIGYAVADAAESLKAVADRITVRAEHDAIARIIEEL